MRYDDRFATAVQEELGDRFKVVNSQGLIVAQHAGGARLLMRPSGTDRRKPVDRADMRRTIQNAVSTGRRHMAAFTEKAKAEQREMLADLGGF